MSNDLVHDVSMVYVIQRYCVTVLKELNSNISVVEYFTDGCAGQYKTERVFIIYASIKKILVLVLFGHFLPQVTARELVMVLVVP